MTYVIIIFVILGIGDDLVEKVMKLLLFTLGLCVIFSGCSRITTNEETSSPSLESISPDTVNSSNPGGIEVSDYLTSESPTPKPNTNPDVLQELPDYTLQELFDFYSSSDGAFSEGAMAELIERFVVDSNSFLTALSKVDDDTKLLIANDLGLSMKVWGGSEYEECLRKAESSDLDVQQSELLKTIRKAFETATY